MISNKLIVLDTDKPFYRKNRILSQPYAAECFDAIPIPELNRIAREAGWQIMTGDVFLKEKPRYRDAVCLSFEATKELKKIVNHGVKPVLLVCGESPNVDWDFYHKLNDHSRGFIHACLFKGVSTVIDGATAFHPYYWPTPTKLNNEKVSFEKRHLLGMVSSFKERYRVNRKLIASRLVRPLRWVKIKWYQLTDPYADFPDLYQIRMDAVKVFAHKSDFFLYGRHWDVARTYLRKFRSLKFANPPSVCEDKFKTLASFRFTLAIENCKFPGYVTEKIFDAMQAGTVPIYLGAPDILEFVPENCFIDMRKYCDFDDLWLDISSWDAPQWHRTTDAIKTFLSSSHFNRFRVETVAANYFKWLTEGR